MQLSIEAGTIKQPIAYEKYMDESFVKAAKAGRHRAVNQALQFAVAALLALLLLVPARPPPAPPRRRSRPAYSSRRARRPSSPCAARTAPS